MAQATKRMLPKIPSPHAANPWNPNNYFMVNGIGVLAFSSSIEVDVKIQYETGVPFITPKEEAKAFAPWTKKSSRK